MDTDRTLPAQARELIEAAAASGWSATGVWDSTVERVALVATREVVTLDVGLTDGRTILSATWDDRAPGRGMRLVRCVGTRGDWIGAPALPEHQAAYITAHPVAAR